MAPNYPHPDPKLTLDVIEDPNGTSITGLPQLGSLVGNVKAWMAGNGVKGASWVPIETPGAVLVVANGKMDVPYSGQAAAEVLNGTMNHAEVSRLHTQWQKDNAQMLATHKSPKYQSADAQYTYATRAVLEQVCLSPSNGGTSEAYTDKIGKKIYINGHVNDGSILVHEYFHTFDQGDPSDIGWGFDEGCVDFFARDVSAKYGYKYVGNGGYEGGYKVVKAIVDDIGLEKMCQFWFERSADIFNPLSAISKEIAELCKPCEEANVPGEMIKRFCETAMGLTGWHKVVAVPSTAPGPATPAKKWPTVKSAAGNFRSHG